MCVWKTNQKLQDLIGSGFIRYKLQDNACVLVVSPVIGLKKVVELLNGELITPKIHQLHDLIDWLNKNHNANITKLSGFIDVVFQCNILNGAKKRKISCRLRIEQRMVDPVSNENYIKVLTDISNFLNCNLLIRKQKSTGNEYYCLTASSKFSLNLIVSYLEIYPLFSSKYLDYKDWSKIVFLILDNKHYTEQGINETEYVRNGINRKRTIGKIIIAVIIL